MAGTVGGGLPAIGCEAVVKSVPAQCQTGCEYRFTIATQPLALNAATNQKLASGHSHDTSLSLHAL